MALLFLARIETKVGPLDVYYGYDNKIVSQLGEKSRSTRMLKTVPRDSRARFVTPEAFQKWVTKGEGGRLVYTALDPNRLRTDGTPELAVFSWFGEKRFPGNRYTPLEHLVPQDTYAVRTYGTQSDSENFYEGTGAAKRVSQIATAHYANERLLARTAALDEGRELAIFLETDAENPARAGLYRHLYGENSGYIDLGEHFDVASQTWRAGMVLPLSVITSHGIPIPYEYIDTQGTA